jgi:hypothetical protein
MDKNLGTYCNMPMEKSTSQLYTSKYTNLLTMVHKNENKRDSGFSRYSRRFIEITPFRKINRAKRSQGDNKAGIKR